MAGLRASLVLGLPHAATQSAQGAQLLAASARRHVSRGGGSLAYSSEAAPRASAGLLFFLLFSAHHIFGLCPP